MKLNYGCGSSKIEGYINIDIEKTLNPDVVCDARYGPLPYAAGEVDEIVAIHVIEHIEHKFQPRVLQEFHRVLKPGGILRLAYPEFAECANNFLMNKDGLRDFWRATLYGRQLYPGDFHVTPMVTSNLIEELMAIGFNGFVVQSETPESFNTTIECTKCEITDWKKAIADKLNLSIPSLTSGRFTRK